ncbi:GNAT family N-acetyltransferase [Yoonia sp. 2307UL14-13]|uniref:GNAT family N-acetyltransferase n=1 Tax=Yoonia sp. 2307UL14-13 TaxID=3126506 RepID=UPI0030994A39
MIPLLTTDRLTLGPFTMAQYEAFRAFCETDRSVYMGGPTDDPRDAWDSCMQGLGQWIARGYGAFFMTETATGAPVGRVQLRHPIDLQEPELAWAVYADFEGQGLAREGVLAVRDYAYRTLSLGPLMSLIAPENTRSIRLAEKLGCVPDGEKTDDDAPSVTIYRHPGVAA